ncbi:MAG: topoisomerase C-terminal repeat-containing protein [Microthrixaceae bacterium]
MTLEEALRIFAEPKRRGRAAAKGPLREMGPDPDSQKPIVVKDGRFGPYVTDGETNASLRKGDSVEELTLERAVELLADRRARGPAKKASKKKSAAKKPAKKAAAKKASAKKATAKKAAAKKPAKKAAAKKPAKNAAAKKADPVDDSATESGD